MTTTIFRTPILRPLLALSARVALRLSGWQVVGRVPAAPRCVLIAAPHTSNWDFVLMLLAVLAVGLDVHWMGKHTLFARPFGRLMRWLGGIPVDRTQSNRTAAQIVARFRAAGELVVLITPEGTRAQVARWKTGFYHIAVGAGVPIVLAYVDAATRSLGIGPQFAPSGDLERDLPLIQAFYADKTGVRRR